MNGTYKLRIEGQDPGEEYELLANYLKDAPEIRTVKAERADPDPKKLGIGVIETILISVATGILLEGVKAAIARALTTPKLQRVVVQIVDEKGHVVHRALGSRQSRDVTDRDSS